MSQQTIVIPEEWTAPKYQLGQWIKQGLIVGIEYYLPNSFRGNKYGAGWIYWVMPHKDSEDTETWSEESVKPLTEADLQEMIQKEVNSCNTKIAALTEQLELIKGVQQ
ncbi:hypothetical protein WA1_18945 [Scytonema hofmannii PCC 7110]|uniref:Uncharacterized protein n=1 Tax=Scytonema hofmannii PCC 7110 TaxID=128403 RepID=A0A139XBL5_9CYAN|nr:hypothetical protein [Scytonema hofmannii]KYC42081.1 hypothetical protein WA1_18945 [Scytonema hofmannii PCC 7110]